MTAKVLITLAFDGASDPVPLRALRLDRGLAHPVGRAELALPNGVTAPTTGTTVTIGVTLGGTDIPLMTGDVAWRGIGADHTQISVLEPSHRLLQSMPAKSYGTTTAGSIISDLCSTADVPTATILPGATIPHMVLRGDRTMLDHITRLAHLSGLAISSDTDGRLNTVALAVPVPTPPPALGRAPLRLVDTSRQPNGAKPRFIGAGTMGTNGPGTTTLPLADPSLISAGPNDASQTHHIAAIRTLADATLAQLAAAQRASARNGGLHFTTPLPENLSPGDVTLLPDANGLPLRLSRLENLSVTMTANSGLLAQYRFSDLEAL